jgi:hypothetical protein
MRGRSASALREKFALAPGPEKSQAGGEPSDEAALWKYGAAGRVAVASGGIARAAGAGKSVQSQEEDGGVSNKTGWEGCDQQWGARIGTVWTLSRALGPAKENIYALESIKGYIVWGC